MRSVPAFSDTSSSVAFCPLQGKAIIDAQALAAKFSLSLPQVLRAVAALVSSLYRHSDIVGQATVAIPPVGHFPPQHGLDYGEVCRISIDASVRFLDFVKSLSAQLSTPESAEHVTLDLVHSSPMIHSCNGNTAVDVLVGLYESSRDLFSLLGQNMSPGWVEFFSRSAVSTKRYTHSRGLLAKMINLSRPLPYASRALRRLARYLSSYQLRCRPPSQHQG